MYILNEPCIIFARFKDVWPLFVIYRNDVSSIVTSENANKLKIIYNFIVKKNQQSKRL